MYYLRINDTQAGPYTLQQVQSMWNAGKITALTLYSEKGSTDWQPLGNIISIIEPGTSADGSSTPKQAGPEQVLWSGNPTLWKWTGHLLGGVVLCVLAVGIYFYYGNGWLLVALGLVFIAALIFGYVYLSKIYTRYSVTNKRVDVETGFITKKSRELRIQDIRSIAANVNLLGYGNVEFASAAQDDADVIFHAVAGAAAIRDMVKKLQS